MNRFLKLLLPGLSGVLPKKFANTAPWISMIIIGLSVGLCLIFQIKINESICNLALPALSIFTALVFSAIFTVPSQLSERLKETDYKFDEPSVNFLIRYRNFIHKFSEQLISITLISILLIVLIILLNVFKTQSVFITGLIITFSLNLVILIITTISNIAHMIEENITYSTNRIKKIKSKIESQDQQTHE